jgi:hypothetical protein
MTSPHCRAGAPARGSSNGPPRIGSGIGTDNAWRGSVFEACPLSRLQTRSQIGGNRQPRDVNGFLNNPSPPTEKRRLKGFWLRRNACELPTCSIEWPHRLCRSECVDLIYEGLHSMVLGGPIAHSNSARGRCGAVYDMGCYLLAKLRLRSVVAMRVGVLPLTHCLSPRRLRRSPWSGSKSVASDRDLDDGCHGRWHGLWP